MHILRPMVLSLADNFAFIFPLLHFLAYFYLSVIESVSPNYQNITCFAKKQSMNYFLHLGLHAFKCLPVFFLALLNIDLDALVEPLIQYL